MSERRGLTLLEVLFAAAMLAMLAATCAPLLRSAQLASEEPDEDHVHAELQQLVEEFLEEPTRFGIDDPLGLESFTLEWPSPAARQQINVQRIDSISHEPIAQWLVFTCGESFVLRRFELEKETVGGSP